MQSTINLLATVLVVEDDKDTLELQRFHLQKEGFKVLEFNSTKGVYSTLQKQNVDLIVMDRTLPNLDGTDFVRFLRDNGILIPIIFVTDKIKDYEVEEGFESGGDDYLKKPFNTNEFIYRVKSLLKRNSYQENKRLKYRDITLDINTRQVFINEDEVDLTKLEFNLLSFFIQNKNSILERDYLLHHVWKDKNGEHKRKVNVTINRLRNKIDPDNTKHYIEPIRGIGYKFI
ncbi:MAG: response regulator transcription factor [Campylobacterales bacterium]|nr:response regulator transcription factor [Campylobacterales bacterium]